MTPTAVTAVSVDAVVLRASGVGVQLMVHRRPLEPFSGEWALPGVLLLSGESLTDATVRAAGKGGVTPKDVVATGQLAAFNEPNRDPRGPTLSVATWAVVQGECLTGSSPNVRWVGWDAIPPLAFDHARILHDVRPLLSEKLWRDRVFTEALTGDVFDVRTALAISDEFSDDPVDRGNLNRVLRRVAVRCGTTEPGPGGGRPGARWRWL